MPPDRPQSSATETAGSVSVGEGSVHGTLLAFADSLLARSPVVTADTPAETEQLVTFFLGDTEFGVPIARCREVGRVGEIARIPESPPHVRGAINLRGRVVPIVDLRSRLGMTAVTPGRRTRVLVVETHGRDFGLLVDRVARVLRISVSSMECNAAAGGSDCAVGCARTSQGPVALLDVDRVLVANPPRGEQR